MMKHIHSLLLAAILAVLGISGAGNEAFARNEPLFHWREVNHPPGGNLWSESQYWEKGGIYPHSGPPLDIVVTFFALPPGPIVNVFDTPVQLASIMYMQKTMDGMMNPLHMRGPDDLQFLSTTWLLGHQNDFVDGVVFNLLEHNIQATGGYQASLASPLAIPLTLISMTPTGGHGGGGAGGTAGLVNPELELVYHGVVPVGALNMLVIDPVVGLTSPTLFTNDHPFEFEFTITVPEPGAAALIAGLCAAAGLRRRRR